MKHIQTKIVRTKANPNISKKRVLPKRTIITTKIIEKPMLNIITRTSGRPNGFKRCSDSIKNQTYKHVRHIVSIDSLEDKEYVEKAGVDFYFIDKQKIKSKPDIPNPNTGKKFIYNLYFNELFSKVKDGWILILDDDDFLANSNVVQTMVNRIQNNSDMLIWQMRYPTGVLLPSIAEMVVKPRLGRIGSPCVMVHSSIAKTIKWDGWKCGDYRYISQVWDKTETKQWLKKPLIQLGGAGFGLKKDVESKKTPTKAQKKVDKLLVDFKKKFVKPIITTKNIEGFEYIYHPIHENNKYDFVITIPSFSRPKGITNLVQSLTNQIKVETNLTAKIIVIDDKSPKPKTYDNLHLISPDITVIRNLSNNGKYRYWQTISNIFSVAKKYEFRWLIQLDDDFEVTSNFLTKVQTIINANKDKKFIIKGHLDNSSHKVRWNLNHWIDGGGIYPKEFLNKIDFKISPIALKRWATDPKLSSGVWSQVSKKINRLGYIVVIPAISLANHLGEESRMNTSLRKQHKIQTKNFLA